MTPADLKNHLQAYGLHVVTDADMHVLEACAAAEILSPVDGLHGAAINVGEWRVVQAELARRLLR